jgi:hypothetical protein
LAEGLQEFDRPALPIVHGDGAVSYVRETYQCVLSTVPVDELPPAEPYTCTLKPPSYFEACVAAIEALEGREPYPPEGTGIAAWACALATATRPTTCSGSNRA